jgi:non-heme chloroperoxidase
MHRDDDLIQFAASGPPPLPAGDSGYAETSGARIWYASMGQGPAVVLLHGGMGNATNWGYQVPALIEAGYRAVVIDSRGQGRSTNDGRPFSYAQMADDTLAVLDTVGILDRAAFIGWSDGACTSLILADNRPDRAAGVFFFACNVDETGTKPFVYTETIGRCLERHKKDWAALSPTPDAFDTTFEAVGIMQRSQPNYTAADLARIRVPFWSVIGEHDEFMTQEHAAYLVRTVPGAEHRILPGVSHFAPVQRPEVFNAAMLDFLRAVAPTARNS